jgi:hypothetical protein
MYGSSHQLFTADEQILEAGDWQLGIKYFFLQIIKYSIKKKLINFVNLL